MCVCMALVRDPIEVYTHSSSAIDPVDVAFFFCLVDTLLPFGFIFYPLRNIAVRGEKFLNMSFLDFIQVFSFFYNNKNLNGIKKYFS